MIKEDYGKNKNSVKSNKKSYKSVIKLCITYI